MRANIEYDDKGYVISLNVDANGKYELPEGFNPEDAFYYHLVDGELVLDEELKQKTEQEDEKEYQIAQLREQLARSDDDLLAFIEDWFSLKNPLTFISDMFSLMKNYAAIVSERQSIRQRIKELGG